MLFKNITLIGEDYKAVCGSNILVENGVITSIGPEAPAGYSGEVYDGNGKIAAPGFFNTHSHSPMTLLRGYGEGLPLHDWLFNKMFPFEALLTEEDIYWGSMLGIAEMLRTGAASFTDMYFATPQIAKAVEESGIKANISHGANGAEGQSFKDVPAFGGTAALMEIAKTSTHGRIIADASIHAEYTSTPGLCEDIADFAKQNNLRIHLHLSETKKEHEECIQRRGLTPAGWFKKLGVFDVPVTAAHCVWVSDRDIEIMAEHGVTAVHCPSSNLKLGSGIAPLRKMKNRGVQVAVGTDGAASNNNLNVLEEVNLAALVQKGTEQDPLFLSTAEIFEMACRNGALSQGRKDCGAIKVGNKADIIVFDTDKPHMLPLIDPVSNVLFSSQSEDIVLNMVDGKVLYKKGEFATIDIEKVKFHAKRIAGEKLAALEK